jgi:hypothetical protein
MQQLSEDDTDFWAEIDKPMRVEDLNRTVQRLPEQLAGFKQTLQQPYHQEKFQKLVDQARNAAKEAYRNKLKVGLHKMAKEYQERIREINRSHRQEISEFVKKFWKLDEVLTTRDEQIDQLQKFFIAEEEEIAFQRMHRTYKEPVVVQNSSEVLQYENGVLKVQMQTFRELIGVYENDVNKLKEKVAEMERENAEILRRNEVEKIELNGKIGKIHEEYKRKILELNQSYIEFKKNIGVELELKQVITNRQQNIISGLKQDLTVAKEILDTPRLLFKYNSRMPYKHKVSKSVMARPIKSNFNSKTLLHRKKFSSKDTLSSTRATPVFTLTPDIDYPSSILPPLSEYDYR